MADLEFEVKKIPVAERYGEYAVGGHVGEEIARELGGRTLLLVDFEGVPAPDGYMLLNLIGNLTEMRRAKLHEDSLWAFTNTNRDTYDSADVVAGHLKTGVICQTKEGLRIAGTTAVRAATYIFASQLSRGGSFSAQDLASKLNIEPTTTNMRLKNLLPTGSLAMWPADTPNRGKQAMRYRAVLPEDIS